MKMTRFIMIGSSITMAMLLVASAVLPRISQIEAAVSYGHIIDDSAFENQSSGLRTASGIDSWLNSNYPSGCISGSFRAPDPQGWSSTQNKMLFGSNVTAGRVIYDAGRIYNINPQVLLATLQKEQSAVSGGAGCHPNSPDPNTATSMTDKCGPGTRSCTLACTFSGGCLNIAMGYGCPSFCDVKYEGFSKQVIWAANTLRFAEVRSKGILTGYVGHDPGDENLTYSGPMTRGYRQRVAGGATHYYDGTYTPKDASTITIGTGGTASLYNYTPFESGNGHFYSIFVGWFGDPNTPCYATGNISGQPSGRQILVDQYNKTGEGSLAFTRLNNTGSACVEDHVWTSSLRGWQDSMLTILPAVNPTNVMMVSGDFAGDHRDELIYAKFTSSSDQAEIHMLDKTGQSWLSRTATNLSNTSPAAGTFVAGDMNGDGKDELMYVKYSGGSGQVEVYRWNPDFKSWASHGVTNLSTASNTSGRFITGDMNGDGKDELMYVKYSGGSGKVEVYTWAPGFRSWASHKITNLDATSSSVGTFVAGDMNGDGKDELMYVKYSGGSGQTEVHTWAPLYHEWDSHRATSLAAFDPST